MAVYLIEGGHKIEGEFKVHGAKNSALPILAASLLPENVLLHNCPRLSDVEAACNILEGLGCRTERIGSSVSIVSAPECGYAISHDLMREMRSSIVFLGAILAKCGQARISFPGGCELGPRPIDLHLEALKKLGAVIEEDHGYLDCTVPGGFKGADIVLAFPSVGATENIMLAACVAKGTTTIRNAAREPEIADLAGFLNACGANIEIVSDSTIVIEGVEKLGKYVEYRVMPDRIEAATYLCAAAVTGGDITVKACDVPTLAAVLPFFEEMGCKVTAGEEWVRLIGPERLKAIKSIRTMPYPGFPTDAQSPLMAITTLASGTSIFIENIFESRYKHVGELIRMGANIKVEGRVAVVEGVSKLHSAKVQCTDLRGGAALCIAALAADGITEVTAVKHIERGYENFVASLKSLGANIWAKF